MPMAVLRPRNRIVYFRVSEDEFHQVHRVCQATGARSISDLARSAMRNMIQAPQQDQPSRLFDRLSLLETLVANLNDQIHQLTLTLRGEKPTINEPGCESQLEDPAPKREGGRE